MRAKIVAGNWKMNKLFNEGLELAKQIADIGPPAGVELILCPPAYLIAAVSEVVKSANNISVSGQHCHEKRSGAFTGEHSAAMLKSVGASQVILGHSERRAYFGETDESLKEKIEAAWEQHLKVIYCCGEPLEVREANQHIAYIQKQLEKSLLGLENMNSNKLAVAYEPIWAIGTGKTASSQEAEEMHAFIRAFLENHFGKEMAESCAILYGGSVKPSNAKDLFAMPNIDGGLIGGASLKADDFLAISASF